MGPIPRYVIVQLKLVLLKILIDVYRILLWLLRCPFLKARKSPWISWFLRKTPSAGQHWSLDHSSTGFVHDPLLDLVGPIDSNFLTLDILYGSHWIQC